MALNIVNFLYSRAPDVTPVQALASKLLILYCQWRLMMMIRSAPFRQWTQNRDTWWAWAVAEKVRRPLALGHWMNLTSAAGVYRRRDCLEHPAWCVPLGNVWPSRPVG